MERTSSKLLLATLASLYAVAFPGCGPAQIPGPSFSFTIPCWEPRHQMQGTFSNLATTSTGQRHAVLPIGATVRLSVVTQMGSGCPVRLMSVTWASEPPAVVTVTPERVPPEPGIEAAALLTATSVGDARVFVDVVTTNAMSHVTELFATTPQQMSPSAIEFVRVVKR